MTCARRDADAHNSAPSAPAASSRPDPHPGRRRARFVLLLPALALLLGALGLFAAAPDALADHTFPVPSNFQTSVGDRSITVSWDPVPNAGLYLLQRKKKGESNIRSLQRSETTVTFGPSTQWVTDGGSSEPTRNGATYQFRIRVLSNSGHSFSPYSEWIEATPNSVPGKPAVTLDAGSEELGVSWTAPIGSVITGYAVQYKESDAADVPATTPNDPSTGWVAHAHSGTATTATIGGLTDGTGYDVRVRATNAVGDGPWSDAAQGTPEGGRVPAAPARPTATAAVTEVAVSWTAPYDRGSAITAYHVQYFLNRHPWTDWRMDLTGTTTTITGLLPGRSYGARVRAMNAAGWSAWTPYVVFHMQSTFPGKPAVTVDAGNGALGVSWSAETGGLAITGYTVQYKESDAADAPASTPNDPSTGWVQHAHSGTARTATIGGLTNGTGYDVRVSAWNAKGVGEWSDAAQGTPESGRAPDAPAKPTVEAGATTVTMSWTAPYDRGSPITGYFVQYATDGGLWNDVALFTGTTATVTGLAPGTGYWVRVHARNANGVSAWSPHVRTVTLSTVPGPPVGLAVTPGAAKLDLEWTAPSSSPASYDVHYTSSSTVARDADATGSNPATAWVDASHTGTTATHAITGLTNGTAYRVRVRGVNAVGDGAWAWGTGTPKATTSGSTDASLSGLELQDAFGDPIAFEETFAPTTYAHTANVGDSAAFAVVAPTVNESNATVKVNGKTVASGETSDILVMSFGANRIVVEVTAQAGNTRNYTITVNRSLPTVSFASTTLRVHEGESESLLLQSSVVNDMSGTVSYAAGGTHPASLSDDLGSGRSTAFTMTIRSSEPTPISVPAVDDALNEEDETFTITIEPGTGYTVGSPSVVTVTIVDNDPPAAPGGFAVAAGDAKLTASWTKPDGPVTGYKLRWKETAAPDSDATGDGTDPSTGWVEGAEVSSPTLTAEIASLTNGTGYDVQVRATDGTSAGADSDGYGPWSATQAGTPAATASAGPDAPTGLTLASGNAQLTASWTAPSDTPAGYDVHYTYSLTVDGDAAGGSTNDPSSAWVAVSRGTEASPPATSQAITGLDNGRIYRVRVRTKSADGDSAWAHRAGTPEDPTPAAPRFSPANGATVTDAGRNITLSFAEPIKSNASNTDFDNTTIDAIVTLKAGSSTGSNIAFDATIDSAKRVVTIDPSSDLSNGAVYVAVSNNWYDADGNRGDAANATFTVSDPPPARVTDLTGHGAPETVVLTWTAVTGPGTVTGYDVHYTRSATVDGNAPVGSDRSSEWVDASHTGTGATQSIVGLSGGQEYRFRVRAKSAAGAGAWAFVRAVPRKIPEPPGLVVGPGNAKLDLAWRAPPGTVTGYDVHYTSALSTGDTPVGDDDDASGSNPATAWVAVSRTGTDTTVSQSISSLTNGTAYRVRVRGKNAGGEGSWAHGTGTPAADAVTPPGRPTNLMTRQTMEGATVTWTAPAGTVTGYDVHATSASDTDPHPVSGADPVGDDDDASGSDLTAAWVNLEHSGTTASHAAEGLTGAREYRFRVRAKNAGGAGVWAFVRGVAGLPPGAVTGLGVAAGDATLDLSWTAPAGTVPAGYDVHYTSASAGSVPNDQAASGNDPSAAWVAVDRGTEAEPPAVSQSITGLANGTQYRVRVRAVTGSGGGPWVHKTGTPAKPTMGFGTHTEVVAEGESETTTVKLNAALAVDTIVNIEVVTDKPASGRAVEGADFRLSATTLSFAAGETEKTLRVSFVADETTEGEEIFFLRLAAPSGTAPYQVREIFSERLFTEVEFSVLDNSQDPGLRINAGNVAEGDDGLVVFELGSPAPSGGAAVTLSLGSTGTATEGTDFTLSSKTATIAEGETFATVTLTALADEADDDGETVVLNASSTNPAFTAQTVTVFVVDTDAPAASAPQNVAAAPGDGTLTVTWEVPAALPVSDPAYEVVVGRRKTGSGADLLDISNNFAVPEDQRDPGSMTLTGLSPVAYDVGVWFNYRGEADPVAAPGVKTPLSSTIAVVTSTPLPGDPTGLGVTPGDTTLAVSWTAPTGTVTGYDVHYTSAPATGNGAVGDDEDAGSNTDASTGWVAVDRGTEADPPAVSQSITGLDNGTLYRVRVRTKNAHGDGAWVRETGTPAAQVSNVPTGLTVSAGDGALTASWTAPSGVDVARYEAQVKLKSAANWPGTDTDVTSGTSHTFTGLTNGSPYQVRVRTVETGESVAGDWTAPVEGTPAAPVSNVPTGLTVSAGDGALTASWTAPSGVDVARYEAQVKLTSAASWPASDTDVTGTSHTFTGLTNGSPYQVRVRTVVTGGTAGDWTAPVAGTPVAAPSSDAALRALTAGGGTSAGGTYGALALTPSTFSASVTSYTAAVGHSLAYVKLTPTANHAAATLGVRKGSSGAFTPVTSGRASAALALDVGANALTVRVTAQDTTTVKDYTVTVTRRAPDAPLTASFEGVPAEHDGKTAFAVLLRLSEPAASLSQPPRAASFRVRQGRLQRIERVGADLWRVWLKPITMHDVQVTLEGGRGCAEAGAVCTRDGRALKNTVKAMVGEQLRIFTWSTFSKEGRESHIEMRVGLSRTGGVEQEVTVDWETADGTTTGYELVEPGRRVRYPASPATAGADYTAASGTLTFAPGEWNKFVKVPILDDAVDEGTEYFLIRFSNPQGAGAVLAQDQEEQMALISNDDHLQTAWLARFGRTVGSQVTDAVSERLQGGLAPGAHATLAGQRVDLSKTDDGKVLAETLTGLARAFGAPSGAANDDPGSGAPGSGPGQAGAGAFGRHGFADPWSDPATSTRARSVTGRELLLGSAFHLATGDERSGPGLAAWGRVALGSFEGEHADDTGHTRVDGEVLTGVLGADADFGRVLAGVAVSLSEGDGSFGNAGADVGGKGGIESTMTTVSPYARFKVTERVTAWGLAGWGTGDMTIRFDDGSMAPIRTDLSMRLGAIGARGALMEQDETGGMDLALKADAFFVTTESEKAANSAGTTADASRVRLVLEAGARSPSAAAPRSGPRWSLGSAMTAATRRPGRESSWAAASPSPTKPRASRSRRGRGCWRRTRTRATRSGARAPRRGSTRARAGGASRSRSRPPSARRRAPPSGCGGRGTRGRSHRTAGSSRRRGASRARWATGSRSAGTASPARPISASGCRTAGRGTGASAGG